MFRRLQMLSLLKVLANTKNKAGKPSFSWMAGGTRGVERPQAVSCLAPEARKLTFDGWRGYDIHLAKDSGAVSLTRSFCCSECAALWNSNQLLQQLLDTRVHIGVDSSVTIEAMPSNTFKIEAILSVGTHHNWHIRDPPTPLSEAIDEIIVAHAKQHGYFKVDCLTLLRLRSVTIDWRRYA